MRENNKAAAQQKSNIKCIEVLIAKSLIGHSSHNLSWTLSVYSLHNQPVKKDTLFNNSEIFHFMVYDWERTVKQLLDEVQVPYSVIQYFDTRDVHGTVTDDRELASSDAEKRLLSAVKKISENHNATLSGLSSRVQAQDTEVDILLERES